MKFSSIALLVAATASSSEAFGFAPSSKVAFSSSSQLKASGYDFGGLETKVLEPTAAPEPKAVKKEKAPKEKKEKAPKESKPKKESKKEKAAREAAEAEAAAKAAEIEAALKAKAAEKPSKATYDKEIVKKAPKKVVVPKAAPSITKKEKSAVSAPSISLPSLSLPKAKDTPDDNALLGIAVGAAPLVAVPVIGLSALRTTLSNTAARRAEIQAEIAAFEEEKKKKAAKASASPDGAVLGQAVVSVIIT